jgi:hypothetical protein
MSKAERGTIDTALSGIFCDTGRELFVSHVSDCESCKRGIRLAVEGFPLLKMVIPPDKLQEVLNLLKPKG